MAGHAHLSLSCGRCQAVSERKVLAVRGTLWARWDGLMASASAARRGAGDRREADGEAEQVELAQGHHLQGGRHPDGQGRHRRNRGVFRPRRGQRVMHGRALRLLKTLSPVSRVSSICPAWTASRARACAPWLLKTHPMSPEHFQLTSVWTTCRARARTLRVLGLCSECFCRIAAARFASVSCSGHLVPLAINIMVSWMASAKCAGTLQKQRHALMMPVHGTG